MSNDFKIGRVESTREHLLADTFEIAIAFGDYEQVSLTDAQSIISSTPPSPEELLPLGEPDIDDNNMPDEDTEVEINEKLQARVEAAMRHIEYRSACLGPHYPFTIEDETLTLRKELSASQNLYLLLLACSRTRSFKAKGTAQRLADRFEEVSAACLKRMMPANGKVFMFGPNSDDRKNIFGSQLSVAIPKLCETLGMDIAPHWKAPEGASGDGKVDIVGVFDFSDTAKGYSVIVGQCASMEDERVWQKKRQEANLETKRGTFHFLVCPTPALFFPSFYRSADGDWIDRDNVSGVVAIDRYRLLKTLIENDAIDIDVDALFKSAGITPQISGVAA
jgi:hypothetical protein